MKQILSILTLSLLLLSCEDSMVNPIAPKQETSELSESSFSIYGDYKGRIRRIRLRERDNGTDYSISVEADGSNPKEVASVKLQFNEPFEGPTPTEATLDIPVDEYDAKTGTLKFTYPKLAFKGGEAAGTTYSITAIMVSPKGEQLGKAVKMEVMAEPTPIKVQQFSIYSKGGKTWEVEVVIIDRGGWVEKTEIEFLKSDGPMPENKTVYMKQVEGSRNKKVYRGQVQFRESPTGYEYSALVYAIGRGTRVVGGTSSNRAELL